MSQVGRARLGRTGIEVSDLCLGTDYYGSRTPPDTAWQLLDAFAAAGGTFIDTNQSPLDESGVPTAASVSLNSVRTASTGASRTRSNSSTREW